MGESERDFFDRMASQWDSMIEVNPDKISHILDVAQVGEGNNVLDVGTGTGVLIPFLLPRIGKEGHILAVDISEGMLKEAKRKFSEFKEVEFRLVDVENDNLPEKYDRIIMYCMYPHLLSPEETVEWLAKVNLKPGGTLTIAFPESKESINNIHHHKDGTVHSNHLMDGGRMKFLFATRGLNVDYVEDTDDFYIIRIKNSPA